jgi:hypothetical protein
MSDLGNVHEAIRAIIRGNLPAREFAKAAHDVFTISFVSSARRQRAIYLFMYLNPAKSIADAMLIDREILGLVADFDNLQSRTINVIKELISGSNNRLERTMAVVIHSDPRGDEKLRAWGREAGLTIIPVFRGKDGLPLEPDGLRRQLAQELFAADPFQVTGPVVHDMDFFGRGNDAAELLRQLEAGRIRSLFGIRKVGKTSMLNRVIKLARDRGSCRVAMIDCSVSEFCKLHAPEALRAVAKVAKMAATQGYAHVSDAVKRPDSELVPVFRDLWDQPNQRPLVLVFDEIDYITPDAPTARHWAVEFNEFWREFRALVQEAQRHQLTIALLIGGVSSKSFRVEAIDGVENAVLHFVPEEYLSPFARGASDAMIRDLGKRCGIRFSADARNWVASVCGDFPFWIRMACSHVHKALDVESRPIEVDVAMARSLLDEFVMAEGADIALVALRNLRRMHPEVVADLATCVSEGRVPLSRGRLLLRYGLGCQRGLDVIVESQMVREGLELLKAEPLHTFPLAEPVVSPDARIELAANEWAEELAVINRRRNQLERRLREFVRFALKLNAPKGSAWTEIVLKALSERRRTELSPLSADALLNKLFWLELDNIITRNWPVFEATLGDKNRFHSAMTLLNDRPDAHAKDIDLADVALQRRELAWLEERVSS